MIDNKVFWILNRETSNVSTGFQKSEDERKLIFPLYLTFCIICVSAESRKKGISTELQSTFASVGRSNDSHMTCKRRPHVEWFLYVFMKVDAHGQETNHVLYLYQWPFILLLPSEYYQSCGCHICLWSRWHAALLGCNHLRSLRQQKGSRIKMNGPRCCTLTYFRHH